MSGRVAILLVLLFCSHSFAEEKVEIPLSEVWGYDRARRELEADHFIKRDTPEKIAEYSSPEKLQEIHDKAQSSLTWQIERSMNDNVLDLANARAFNDSKPAPCFMVTGRDMEALRGIHDVVVNKKEPQHKFSQQDELAIVFFGLNSGVQPRLINVQRRGKAINLDYVLPSNGRLGIMHTLNIIPVGQLPPGKYRIKPSRAYAEEPKYNAQGFESYAKGIEKSFVCEPSEFEVIADPLNQQKEQNP